MNKLEGYTLQLALKHIIFYKDESSYEFSINLSTHFHIFYSLYTNYNKIYITTFKSRIYRFFTIEYE